MKQTEELPPGLQEVARDTRGRVRLAEGTLEGRESIITPTDDFFFVSHGPTPDPIPSDEWRLSIQSGGATSLELDLAGLQQYPTVTQPILLECAGTSRRMVRPEVPGAQLGNGTVACAEWTGVVLRSVLEAAGISESAVSLVATGADSWAFSEGRKVEHFAKALPIAKALDDGVVLAWEMNGRPLSHVHGGPVRLVVPNWYGVWSVKWVTRLEVMDIPYRGYWERDRYAYAATWDTPSPDPSDRDLVAELLIKSLITKPSDGSTVSLGRLRVSGYAWSNGIPIRTVEVTTDGGGHWEPATLVGPVLDHAWQKWNYEWSPRKTGSYLLASVATDARGQRQPDKGEWNPLGYANNGIQWLKVAVVR